MRRLGLVLSVFLLAVFLLVGCAGRAESPKLKVWGVWLTDATEPWVGVTHQELLALEAAGEIDYHFEDEIGYDGSVVFILEQAIADGAKLAVGDSFGQEDQWRGVAGKNAAAHEKDPENVPLVYFLVGSGKGPVQPNFATFDNEIQQASYLAGIAAGATTKTKIVGIVAAKDDPEPNRLCWGFIQGVSVTCPDCVILTSYIGEWFNPPIAQEAAQAQIEVGADVLYAERDGVIDAVKLNPGVTAIGNLLNQNKDEEGNPVTCVLGSAVWYMRSTIDTAIERVHDGTFEGIYYGQYSWLTNGGSEFVINEEGPLSSEARALVEEHHQGLLDGSIRVKVIEAPLPGRIELGSSD